MKKKILTVVGARPQFIKAAVVSEQLGRCAGIDEVILHTGQHFDSNMSDIFFDELDLPRPKFNLGVGGGTHAENTGRAMEGIERIILRERPEMVLVYGDTDSTLAGALAAAKLLTPVIHVEAGLRSGNRAMPEEINRILTDHLATLLFCPSLSATQNLEREGITGSSVHLVGDVMYDAVLRFSAISERRSKVMSDLSLRPHHFILATIHRRENCDNPARLRSILDALGSADVPVILPLHPRTRGKVSELNIQLSSTVRAVAPVGYLDMMMLERQAKLVVTDSGGVQKEAYFHGTPCAVLRDETEWPELLSAGSNCLVGANNAAIRAALRVRPAKVLRSNVYGSGDAAERIAQILWARLA